MPNKERNRAITQGLMSAGLGIMAGSQAPAGHSTIPGIAYGLQMGLDAYNRSLNTQAAQREESAKEAALERMQTDPGFSERERLFAQLAPMDFVRQQIKGSGPQLPKLFKYPEGDETVSQFLHPTTGEVQREVRAPRLPPQINITPYQEQTLGLARQAAARADESLGLQAAAARSREAADKEARAPDKKARALTVAEGKATALGLRGAEAMEQMSAIEDAGYRPNLGTRAGQAIGEVFGTRNMLIGDEGQKYEQAAVNFGTAIGRFESGAAIPESEWDRFIQQYVAMPEDGPGVIAQKRQNRATAIRGIGIASGSGARGALNVPGPQVDIVPGVTVEWLD